MIVPRNNGRYKNGVIFLLKAYDLVTNKNFLKNSGHKLYIGWFIYV